MFFGLRCVVDGDIVGEKRDVAAIVRDREVGEHEVEWEWA